jgi:hypothetical protein
VEIVDEKPPPAGTTQSVFPRRFPLPTTRKTESKIMNTAEATKEKVEIKNFGTPDEVREFSKGLVEVLNIGGATVGRATLQPGWRWAECIQPIAKTKSCEAAHYQYHIAGILRVRMDDGTEYDCKAGDVSILPPGHDAWVVGDEPVIVVDFQGMVDYAKGH